MGAIRKHDGLRFLSINDNFFELGGRQRRQLQVLHVREPDEQIGAKRQRSALRKLDKKSASGKRTHPAATVTIVGLGVSGGRLASYKMRNKSQTTVVLTMFALKLFKTQTLAPEFLSFSSQSNETLN